MVQENPTPLRYGNQSEMYREAVRYEPSPEDGLGHLQLGDGRALPLPAGMARPRGVAGIFMGLGPLEEATIDDGVLTVSSPFVNPLPESSTSDTIDSIVYAGAQQGDLLLLHVPATNTITVDDAEINLGGDTRAVAPGGSLLLVFDGAQWTELIFTAATDNVNAE